MLRTVPPVVFNHATVEGVAVDVVATVRDAAARLHAVGNGAVEQVTAVAATELGGCGSTVNTVSLGVADPDLLYAGNAPEAVPTVPQRGAVRCGMCPGALGARSAGSWRGWEWGRRALSRPPGARPRRRSAARARPPRSRRRSPPATAAA
ncbi:hypothetical protein GCM10010441_13080 [Kitasatospora paracochleata]